jgi:hypothetical protein
MVLHDMTVWLYIIVFHDVIIIIIYQLTKPLAAVGSNPDSDFGFFHVRKLSI